MAANLREFMREVTRARRPMASVGDQAEEQIGHFADAMAGTPRTTPTQNLYDASPSNMYPNLGRKIGRSAYDAIKGGAEDASIPGQYAWGAKGARMGSKLGRGVEKLDTMGKAVGGAANTVGKGVVKGARYGGQGMQYGGRVLKRRRAPRPTSGEPSPLALRGGGSLPARP